MAWKLALGIIGTLLLVSVSVQASEAMNLADRAGFLVGHAQRCGVEEARLERVVVFSKKLIQAFSADADDAKEAKTQFAQRILAAALASAFGDPLPGCDTVRANFEELEQHRQLLTAHLAQPRGGQMARRSQALDTPSRPGRKAAAKSTRSVRPATTTKPEDLTPEQREEIASKRAAAETRGRPPSI